MISIQNFQFHFPSHFQTMHSFSHLVDEKKLFRISYYRILIEKQLSNIFKNGTAMALQSIKVFLFIQRTNMTITFSVDVTHLYTAYTIRLMLDTMTADSSVLLFAFFRIHTTKPSTFHFE